MSNYWTTKRRSMPNKTIRHSPALPIALYFLDTYLPQPILQLFYRTSSDCILFVGSAMYRYFGGKQVLSNCKASDFWKFKLKFHVACPGNAETNSLICDKDCTTPHVTWISQYWLPVGHHALPNQWLARFKLYVCHRCFHSPDFMQYTAYHNRRSFSTSTRQTFLSINIAPDAGYSQTNSHVR